MKKTIFVVATVLILAGASAAAGSIIPDVLKRVIRHDALGSPDFEIRDFELGDDAFHDADMSAEWWYFDGVFDNGYSVHAGLQVVSMIMRDLVIARLNVYKNGDLEASRSRLYLDGYMSRDSPLIVLDGRRVMHGYTDPSTGRLTYDLSLEIDGASADLRLAGTATGWTGRTAMGGWGVALPEAEATGTITLDGEAIDVSGTGYHDHNWDVTAGCGLNFGWIWGKINSENHTIVWGQIMSTRVSGRPMLIVTGVDGYATVEPGDITIIPTDYSIENRRPIPNTYVLTADSDDISLRATMTCHGLHHAGFGPLRYWRQHVACSGSVTTDSGTETIGGDQIMEIIWFRIV